MNACNKGNGWWSGGIMRSRKCCLLIFTPAFIVWITSLLLVPAIIWSGELQSKSTTGLPVRFISNGDGTVTDNKTDLMWQATETRPCVWKKAVTFCRDLRLADYSDWRLPSSKELAALVDVNRNDPAIDTEFFPATRSSPYWSLTPFVGHPGFAWYIHFREGTLFRGGFKGRRYAVRAVRGGVAEFFPEETEPIISRDQLLQKKTVHSLKSKGYEYQPYPLNLEKLLEE